MNIPFSLRILPLLLLALPFPAAAAAEADNTDTAELATVKVTASADASKHGLSRAFAGGQVGAASRAGVLGNKNNLDNPYSTTSYTNKLIQDKQARSVGDVLQNDPTVRVARGYGNFQESYFIRGFASESDDTMYNGLYGILPRQYIATELFERVEVLRGASAFLNGMPPGGNNIGGTVSVLPKRAPNENLTRISTRYGAGKRGGLSADIARRFGAQQQFGIRVNAAYHDGDTAVDAEKSQLRLFNIGLDWRGEQARLSADLGWQDNKLKATRTNVALDVAATAVPAAPDSSNNWAQPWTYSNERDWFGTLRGEYDFTPNLTGYVAYGFRDGKEQNSLANLNNVNKNGNNGAGSQYRFDNARRDKIHTGEVGLRGQFDLGSVSNEWVLAANRFQLKRFNAYVMDWRDTSPNNLYNPVVFAQPAFSGNEATGNRLDNPQITGKTALTSVVLGDTLSFLDKRLQLTLGLRWQKLHNQDFRYNTQVLYNDYKKSRISPALAAVYKITPQWSVYGNYSEALSQGATAGQNYSGKVITNAGQMLEPYVSKQIELGSKYESNRFGASLAVFSTSKPRNLYVPDGTGVRLTSEGKDVHRGLEMSAYGEVAQGLRVLGGITWLNAKQKTTGSATTDDKRVIGVPKVQANIGVEWEVPQVSGLALDGRLVYTGSSYANATNTLRVSGWTRVDVGVRYRTQIAGHEATFRARVDNLTNRNYWASVGGYPGNGYLNAGLPRSFSLSAQVDF